ncbi:pesticin C-terminus-like muramidase [Dyella sp.]|uniref:pesticin C-terminus-like muramidase n=1 Tax=Dyella sp. TaxID=1869338 RepID=UPI002ED305EE
MDSRRTLLHVAGLLVLIGMGHAAPVTQVPAAKLPTYGATTSLPPSTLALPANPFAVSAGNAAQNCPQVGICQPQPLPTCPHVCIPLQAGETPAQAVAAFEAENHCVVDASGDSGNPGEDDQACTEKWRESETFLQTSEGALVTKGYVPKYTRDVKKNGKVIHKKGEVIGQSGVTVSTGVDLGQQSSAGTRKLIENYVKDKGNPDNVDVDALVKKLDPYFGKKKQDAVDALDKTPLTVTDGEARLLEQAFGYDTQTRVARQFDANNTKGMSFKKLPEEAQTVIIDFAYQYGTSDSKGNVRQTFWKYVYDGDWKKLADWLKGNPDPYTSRRKRESDRLQSGIDSKSLPTSGDPCADSGAGDQSNAGGE